MNNVISIAEATGQVDDHIEWLGENCGINREIVADWNALKSAAISAGFELEIASGFRSFDRQLSIWNRKFLGELSVKDTLNNKVDMSLLNDKEKTYAILLYSALPGTSRHHWGTDIDIYAPNLLPNDAHLELEPWEYQESGYFYTLSNWLNNNAKSFGFYFPYKEYKGGVAAEPWHLSHIKTSGKFSEALSLKALRQIITQSEIAGKSTILENLSSIMESHITI